MARITFDYHFAKDRGTELPTNGYDVLLLFRPFGEDGFEDEFEKDRRSSVKKMPFGKPFRHILKPREIRNLDVRLKIVRNDAPDSGCFTTYRRLNFPPTTTTEKASLGSYTVSDQVWTVSGSILPESDLEIPFSRLRVKLEVKSGQNYEEPVWLKINAKGKFSFNGRRMVLNPEKAFEVLLTVYDETGLELGRHYSVTRPGEKKLEGARIRVGSPFLDVWAGFRATHPKLMARLERFDYDPKQAHRSDDTWLLFRRYTKLNTHQVAEGVILHASEGPAGDPDWTWNLRLDPLYDSDDGFRLPNPKNRLKHGGLHVEACRSLSRGKVPDGLPANDISVPRDTRVWMLGTHVFDDAWDFGTPNHEHNELHPLYVMEPCMGGWFHFVVFESIAIAAEAAKNEHSSSRRWPRTETDPELYREAYLDLNPDQCRDELSHTYNLIVERFRRVKEDQGLADFFAEASIRYAKLGIDLGRPLELSPDPYRDWALEIIRNERGSSLRDVLVDYLDRLFRFLHGPASYAHTPVKGPAPNSFLRCVYATENVWASEASGGQVGEPNPRASLNRATSRPVNTARRELRNLYGELFKHVSDSARRGGLFAGAVLRYRNWAVPSTNRGTENMDAAALNSFGSNEDPRALAQGMEARVDAFWEALTPHLRK